ncbi:PREDICTED: uncharacterized protein LOC106297312 [Brassica oleracea var. oleracea]|uniref:uncharacterized protein LOC106297312 n=1 Tax=Brassica oleracea var. oleracea TaxID=109376 RepID=UPI0006A72CE7|nr:PREDICTED: uncharacterized protein LOC106297312 [Brassica oleracea var. oleracea]
MREFDSVYQHCRLTDLGFQGPKFTWCNKQDEGLICKKLDRILVNEIWLNQRTQAYGVFEAGGCSDHLRGRFHIKTEAIGKQKPFNFTNVVAEMPEFHTMMADYWKDTQPLFQSTSALFRFSKTLKALKPLIRNLSTEKLGKLSLRQRISAIEEKVLKQRAKMHWLQLGDCNNKVFHNAAKLRATKNAIREIKCPSGAVAITQEAIKTEAERFFNDFLSHVPSDIQGVSVEELHQLIPFRYSEEERSQLINPVTSEEIKKVLFQMPNNKSPGPYGFTSDLPQCISSNQSAFVKDRLLVENLLLATEIVKDYHKEDVSPRCAMKIDIAKAFDSVHWPFLLNTLRALHLPEQFVHWIELCVCTPSFSVQVNGELAGFFQSKRGLRQGCALSPYLFVISMNVLSHLLDRAAVQKIIGYHPRCQNILLTHLCFADDLLVFTDGSKRSIEGILKIFEDFAAISGLKISLEKSTLYTAGISEEQEGDILTCFPFASGKLPVRYLGLLLLTRRMTVDDYMPLVEKIRKRMRSSLWVKWIHCYLIRKGSFWSMRCSTAGSWMWRKILKLRDLAKNYLKMEVYNGEHTSFWYDSWSRLGCLKDFLGDGGTLSLGITDNSLVADVMLRHRRRRHRLSILNDVEEEIEKVRSRGREEEDKPLWRQTEHSFANSFSTKKTWQSFRQSQPSCNWKNGVWFSQSTPKYSFIVWVAIRNRLQTCDIMKIWNNAMDGQTTTKVYLLRYAFQALVHSVWRERNARRHGEQPREEEMLYKFVDNIIRLKLLAVKGQGKSYLEEGLCKWFETRRQAPQLIDS